MTTIGTDISHAIALLQQGKLVAIPTETVYGLAGNALDEATVSSIFEAKNRPTFDPLIIHIADWRHAARWVQAIPEKAEALAKAFLPGPLTLLLPKRPIIPDLVTAGSPFVAIRVPAHPMARKILEALDFPLAAPSANPFGYISPTTAEHVAQQLGEKIPYILDGGPCQIGLESTIVGFESEAPVVFRKGGIPIEAIEQIIGPVTVQEHSSSNPTAPGMLLSHYAPGTPLVLGNLKELALKHSGLKVGVLAFREPLPGLPPDRQIVLSAKGDFAEAAQHLFAGLRYLDGLDLDLIFAELLPEARLGRAINDRLRRAAAKR
ncbi:MAG: threonylcarbamoyl-AMP synthase [Saprospiraceae bacterium]|nr:threonylcarbamoyl-AMP synthase [Saprospiraceae bacterium]